MDFRRRAWLLLVFGKFVLRAIVPIMRSESLAVRLPEGPITNNRLYCYYLFPSSIYLLCCNNLNRLENHPSLSQLSLETESPFLVWTLSRLHFTKKNICKFFKVFWLKFCIFTLWAKAAFCGSLMMRQCQSNTTCVSIVRFPNYHECPEASGLGNLTSVSYVLRLCLCLLESHIITLHLCPQDAILNIGVHIFFIIKLLSSVRNPMIFTLV